MYEGFSWMPFLLGLPLGLVVYGITAYINWRIGKKQRLFDERHQTIQRHGKTIAFHATSIAIIIGWVAVIMTEGPQLPFFLFTGVWVVHMMSYAIGVAYASNRN